MFCAASASVLLSRLFLRVSGQDAALAFMPGDVRMSELILQHRKVKVTQASPHVSVLFIDTETLFSSLLRFS